MIYLYSSPFGLISYDWNEEICSHVWLREVPAAQKRSGTDPVSEWFDAYFGGQSTPLPALAEPASEFQKIMRRGLLQVPSGEVRTYGELARTLHTSARAMGQALGANPVPILIPCHRVIAADSLGGFAYGLVWKKRLLEFERGF